MKKRIIALLCISILLLVLTSCSSNTKTAAGTTTALIKAQKDYDVAAISQVVTEFPTTKTGYGLTYDLFSDKEFVELFKEIYAKSKFTVTHCNESGETATAIISVEVPDIKSSYTTALYSAASLVFADENLYKQFMDENANVTGMVPRQLLTMYKNGEIQNVTQEYMLQLKKKDGTWKVVTDDNLRKMLSADLFDVVSKIAAGTDEQ